MQDVSKSVQEIIEQIKGGKFQEAKQAINEMLSRCKDEKERGRLYFLLSYLNILSKQKDWNEEKQRLKRAAELIATPEFSDDFDQGYSEILRQISSD